MKITALSNHKPGIPLTRLVATSLSLAHASTLIFKVDIVLFLMLNDVKGAVIVRFVDIDGIINSHCLNILFRK